MLTRRSWINRTLSSALLPGSGLCHAQNTNQAGARTAAGRNGLFTPDIEISLVARIGKAEIWKGQKTSVYQFRGKVVKGRKGALRKSGSFLGPTLDLIRGERVRIHFENQINEPTIVHWHGMIVQESADGHPQFAVKPGGKYTYEFEVTNRAGTYWYHPHPHGRTGVQVYYGLAGALIVRDPAENGTGIPSGDDEHLLIIQDRRADQQNQFQYISNMMDRMMGVLGDRMLINGKADSTTLVSRKPNRLRLLNLSNARSYKLAWSDGSPMHVISTDGGLLNRNEGPRTVPFVFLAPAQRIDLWEDFSTRQAGSKVTLVSKPFSLPMGMSMGPGRGQNRMPRGMGPGMMGGVGQKINVANFKIANEKAVGGRLPSLPYRSKKLPAASRNILTRIGFRMMRGFLNGKQWDMKNMTHVDQEEILKLNQPVIWTFDNASEPGMSMAHPIHLHGVQFRIVERKGNGAPDLAQGVIDTGDHDTVMVFAGETVKIHVTPTEPGLFVYHCHNLEHEDAGMMRNFLVTE
ncbi:MAG: multicopper oxidase domain-containing protein [Pirellulaceae bacterium]